MTVLSLLVTTNDTYTFVDVDRSIDTALNVEQLFKSLAVGGRFSGASVIAQTTPLASTGTWTTASGTGSQTLVISGVTFTHVWATSDTASAAAMAALVNASSDAHILGVVTATSALGVVTLASVGVGLANNAITLSATGTGASVSGARMTGATNGTAVTFSY